MMLSVYAGDFEDSSNNLSRFRCRGTSEWRPQEYHSTEVLRNAFCSGILSIPFAVNEHLGSDKPTKTMRDEDDRTIFLSPAINAKLVLGCIGPKGIK